MSWYKISVKFHNKIENILTSQHIGNPVWNFQNGYIRVGGMENVTMQHSTLSVQKKYNYYWFNLTKYIY
jgi:hypothetical protein